MQKGLFHSLCLTASFVATCSLHALTAPQTQAADFNFTKIADTNTPIPGGTGNFTFFNDPPSLDDGNVAFIGSGSNSRGVYSNIGGNLRVIADSNTTVPGTTGNFFDFENVSISGSNVAFTSASASATLPIFSGAYNNSEGNLSVIADLNTPLPGVIGNFGFYTFNSLSLSEGDSAFSVGLGFREPPSRIYSKVGGNLTIVADTNTPIPLGLGNFTNLNRVVLDDGDVVFSGSGRNSQTGIYIKDDGDLKVVADNGTPIPDSTRTFTRLDSFDSDNGNVAFYGESNLGFLERGIYSNFKGDLSVVADLNTPIPGGTGNFIDFNPILSTGFSFLPSPSIDNGVVAFVGLGVQGQAGIFGTFGDSLTRVIGAGDLLDGKEAIEFSLSNEGLSGNSVAFLVNFTDGSRGIYRADMAAIPTPALLPGIVGFGVAAWRKRKQAA